MNEIDQIISKIRDEGGDLASLAMKAFNLKSKTEARKLIRNRGLTIAGIKIADPFALIMYEKEDDLFGILENDVLNLHDGKKTLTIIKNDQVLTSFQF